MNKIEAMKCSRLRSRNRMTVAVMLCPVFVALLLVFPCNLASAQQFSFDCGSLDNNGFGPFDYRNPLYRTQNPGRAENPLHLVERYHFTSDVENLTRGASSVNPVDDLDYTLRAFPNHHRALNAMAKYALKNQTEKLGRYTIDCWFSRATRFRPDDAIVRVVYGIFLARKGSRDKALVQYEKALQLSPELTEAHYNIGLLYTDLKRYDLAYEHAIRAYNLGYPLPGLRNRLIKAGAWIEKADE